MLLNFAKFLCRIYYIQISSMSKTQSVRLSLIQDDYFQADPNAFFASLFEHFSLLSWLTHASSVEILDKEQVTSKGEQISIYTFNINHSIKPSFLVEFSKNYQSHQINYCIFEDRPALNAAINHQQLQSTINIIFSMHDQVSKLNSSKKRAVIFIDIIDQEKFFKSKGVKNFQEKCSEKKSKLKGNEIFYPYKEPLSQRNKQRTDCHFNLAFQGGGAKGVSYVGVYKALQELHCGIPITSVIGSSAGGILALAISSEMSPSDISALCLEMDTIPKDKYFKNQDEITPEQKKEFKLLIYKFKCVLHNYGIVESTIFDQAADSFSDIETDNKILQVLESINPSIAELFSLELSEPLKKSGGLFSGSSVEYTRRFNYYGFLMAGMMKGSAVEDIAASCMISLFERHFDPVSLKQRPQMKQKIPVFTKILHEWGFTQISDEIFHTPQFRQKIKTLTLKEYYDINQVEFTCTSVDLNDQILRFFNHKTTPNLPVCKAVQMTGSFPVAFQAQKWRKEWGKYYVHYENTRKQLDLTGHQFTDGGLLANFPIKYLDNEQMRPMYFSHKQNAQRTILYGFGLDQIDDHDTNQEEHQQKLKKAIGDLKAHLESKFSKLRFLKNLINSDSSKELQQVHLNEIPVFDFAIKLMKTFTVADYNLNIECFSKSIIETNVEGRVIRQHKNVKKSIEKYSQFYQNLDNLKNISQSKQGVQPNEVLMITCEKLKQHLAEFQTNEAEVIENVRSQALESLYNYEGTRIKNNLDSNLNINGFIQQLQTLYPEQIFKMQCTLDIKCNLISIINKIHEYFKNLPQDKLAQLSFVYNQMIQAQLQIISRISQRLKIILTDLKSLNCEYISSEEYSELTFIDYQLVFDLMSMERKFFIADQAYLKQIMMEIKKLNLPVISIDKELLDSATHIRSYLNDIITNVKSNKIHLVLESKENSHLYYCGLYSVLQEVLNQTQHQDKKIEMITCADIHSVFAFLLAGGKKLNNIRKEMWKIQDLITMEKDIEKQYQTFKWAQTHSQQMNELLDLTWKDQYKLFEEVQKYLASTKNVVLRDEVRSMKVQYLYSKNQISNSMENVLNYVIESARQVQNIKDETERKKKLAQLLSLRNGKNGKDYNQKNKKISKNTQHLINKLMFHFQEVITYVILNNHLIPSAFQQFDISSREQVWKGVLIKKLLSSKKLELYIKEQLREMKLNSNATLSEFYQFSPRKITLNFTLVNKRQERLEIINRFTKPNMPLWAAIIASTSMPYVLPQFACNQQWQFSPFTDSRMRKMVNYFFDTEQKSIQTLYVAGNFVSTLPLELLTNEKIASLNYASLKSHEQLFIKANQLSQTTASTFRNESLIVKQNTQYTYITFSFYKKPTDKASYKYQATDKHFLSFSNILNLGLDFLLGRFKNIDVGFRDIVKRVEILKLLSTRTECHDNTIMHYYKDQTIKLPIRLGTLDFYKIKKDKQAELNSGIYESQLVVRGIFQNLHVDYQKDTFNYLAKKSTYIQFKTFDDKIQIRFPSKSKWNKQLATKYRIFYKFTTEQKYIKYQDESIVFSNEVDFLYLKFVFPNMKKLLLQQQEMIADFRRLKEGEEFEQNLIFKMNYQSIEKKYLLGVQIDNNQLKTRVLSKLKSYTTSTNIAQQSANQLIKTSLKNTSNRDIPNEDAQRCLIIQTLINFKHNGLFCHCCTHKIKRPSHEKENLNAIDIGKCGKCKNTFNMIGLECVNKKCLEKDLNRYCFPCLLVYLITRKDGQYSCTTEGHQFNYCSLKSNAQIVLCHFCGSAANNYYRDEKCNINLCFKCSLILDSKTTISL